MFYDISYDIAALVIVLVLIAIHYFFYNKDGNNRIFRIFSSIVAFNCALDMLSALAVEQIIPASDTVNIILISLYQISLLFVNFLAYMTISDRLEVRLKGLHIANHLILAASVLLLLINFPTHVLFTFESQEYIKSGIFDILYYVCVWYMISMFVVIVCARKKLHFVKLHVAMFGILLLLLPYLLETLFPHLLLISLGAAAIALIMIYTLETPDYEKLQIVKRQLEESKLNEMESRRIAEQSNSDKTIFLENMSHELRTPINAINGFNKMIQMETSNAEVEVLTKKISEVSKYLLRHVSDILDFSQIETSKIVIKPEEYESVRLYLHNTKKIPDGYMDTSIPQRLYGDVNRIRQVMDNLLIYGERISKTLRPFFEISNLGIDDNKVHLKFAYRFQGLAIPQDQIDVVEAGHFDEEVLTLAIAKKILNNMGSELKIISETLGDTVFSFEVDQQIVDLKEIGRISDACEKYVKRQDKVIDDFDFIAPTAKILAVDDVKINLMVLSGLLAKFKVQVKTVTSGQAAIDYMEENEVDLVFMDIMMPEMDGVETLYNIKNSTRIVSPNAAIVALTANATMGARETYLNEGFDGYLSKPVEIKKIAATLRRFVPNKIEVDWDEVMGIDANGKAI